MVFHCLLPQSKNKHIGLTLLNTPWVWVCAWECVSSSQSDFIPASLQVTGANIFWVAGSRGVQCSAHAAEWEDEPDDGQDCGCVVFAVFLLGSSSACVFCRWFPSFASPSASSPCSMFWSFPPGLTLPSTHVLKLTLRNQRTKQSRTFSQTWERQSKQNLHKNDCLLLSSLLRLVPRCLVEAALVSVPASSLRGLLGLNLFWCSSLQNL